MQDGHSSYHAAAQIAYNTFENYYALLPGYTYKGRLTVGFDIGKARDVVNAINTTILRPNASYLILKQGEEGPPISFDVNLAYQFNYLVEVNADARSVQFGIGLYHQYSPLDNVSIIPGILVEGNKATTGLNPGFEESVFLSYGAQATILWNNYYITPKVVSFDGVATIGVKVGMIFSNFYSDEVE